MIIAERLILFPPMWKDLKMFAESMSQNRFAPLGAWARATELTEVLGDSSALAARADALILQSVASDQQKLLSGDIKTAFMSGGEEHRNIFILLFDVWDILKFGARVNAEISQSCVRSRERHEDMVGPFEEITSLNHAFTSCALDPCVLLSSSNRTKPEVWLEFMWTTCWEEVMKRLTEQFGNQARVRCWCLVCRSHDDKSDSVDSDGESRCYARHRAPQTRAATDRSLKVTNSNLRGCSPQEN